MTISTFHVKQPMKFKKTTTIIDHMKVPCIWCLKFTRPIRHILWNLYEIIKLSWGSLKVCHLYLYQTWFQYSSTLYYNKTINKILNNPSSTTEVNVKSYLSLFLSSSINVFHLLLLYIETLILKIAIKTIDSSKRPLKMNAKTQMVQMPSM